MRVAGEAGRGRAGQSRRGIGFAAAEAGARAACGVRVPSSHTRVHMCFCPPLAGWQVVVVQLHGWFKSMRGGHNRSRLCCCCCRCANGACWRVARVALACLLACGAGGHGQAAAAAQDGLYSSCCHWAILPPGPNGQDSVAFSMFSQHIACTCASTCEHRAVCVLEKNLKPLRAVWYQLLIYHGKSTGLALMGPHLNFCLSVALSESFILHSDT